MKSSDIKRSIGLELYAYTVFRDHLISEDFEKIKTAAWKHFPEKMEKITSEYRIESVELLLDKLGIDFMLVYNNNRYAVDVTTGRRPLVKNKLLKLSSMMSFFDEINCIPVVVRSRRGVLPSNVLDIIEKCSTSYGVKDCRLNADLDLVDVLG